MMNSIQEISRSAELALASYGNFAQLIPAREELIGAGLSPSQADKFIKNNAIHRSFSGEDTFEVTDPMTGEVIGVEAFPNGLSATVFKDKGTETTYLSMRGTDDVRDVVSDVIDVIFLGKAKYQ